MNIADYLAKAKREQFAIGAFNAANLETIKAIISAAKNQNSPVIIEASHGEIEFIGATNFISLVNTIKKDTGLPIFTNLDHAPTKESAIAGINLGFDLVHFNGSHLTTSENITQSKEVVELAHSKNILVETEIDTIPGGSAIHPKSAEEELALTKMTDPADAKSFTVQTGTDILAASFGSIHGLYQTKKHLDLDRLSQIHQSTSAYLSLHGGSDMPDEQVKQAIQSGVVKINVNSELRQAFRQTLKDELNNSEELAIYKIMPPVIKAVSVIIENKIKLFGSSNKI